MPEPEPVEPEEPTEVVNGVTVTEEALKKIGRNVLKDLGIGVEEKDKKVGLLSHNKRRSLKALQVNKYFHCFSIKNLKIFN